MNPLLTFFQELFLLYSIALVGFMLRKKEILRLGSEKTLTTIILHVTLPALIIFGMDVSFSASHFKAFLWLSFLSAFVLIVSSVISFFTVKRLNILENQRNALEGIMIFGNQGFLGIAVCFLLFQEKGVFFGTLFNFVYLICIWTYAIYLFARKSAVLPWRKVFFNSGVLATLLGFVLMLTPGKLPVALSHTLELTGKSTIPLSMLLIGILLGSIPYNELLLYVKNKYLWLSSIYKLILFPLFLVPFYWFSLPIEMLAVAVLLAGMPSAPTISMYAQEYGEDASFAAAGTSLSTILSCLTIPALYGLLLIISSFS